MNYIEFKEVDKIYPMGEIELKALNKATFEIQKGELVVILGQSGSGKSTCLNILGGMDSVTAGHVIIEGKDITKLKEKELANFRRNDIGFVFQFYNLVQNLTAIENIELGTQICKNPLDAKKALKKVGLEDRMHNFPSQMSGGQQQRVSIARAIAKRPKILLCDEPTGALDYQTGKQVLELLEDTCRKEKITTIIISHNVAIAPMADRVIKFKNGRTEDISINDNPISIKNIEW
ncbi:MAG: ABC transporter ATP-binding protein [Clostridia bacterium]|nr:ABC transporter ATP-binding protein [Clostridia bacterium]